MIYYYSCKDQSYVAYSTGDKHYYSPNDKYIGYRNGSCLYSETGETIGYFNNGYLYSENGEALWYKS